jgi:transcription elongation GreA/GreB family factor
MQKTTVIQAIIDALIHEFKTFKRASIETRGGGSDNEARSEGKYDTRSTEANYLADGQARQAETARQAASAYEEFLNSPKAVKAGIGSLVHVDFGGGDAEYFLLGPAAGGMEVDVDGQTITVLTQESPLGKKLTGLTMGATVPDMKASVTALL